jgi:hypothetical protein
VQAAVKGSELQVIPHGNVKYHKSTAQHNATQRKFENLNQLLEMCL